MPYMPPGAREEALARMRGESEDTSDSARVMRTGYVPKPRTPYPGGAAQPMPAPMPSPAQVPMPPQAAFDALRARLVARGLAPSDAARAAGLALQRARAIAILARR